MDIPARRYNSGKPKYSLLRTSCFKDCVSVLEYGRNKYSDFDEDGNMTYDARNNWNNGLVLSEVIDSLKRHIAEIEDGNMIDPESGLPHIGHIQANAMFLGSSVIYNDLVKDGGG